VDVRLERETVWLTQQQMARLFGRERSVIARHIRNVFGTGELVPEGTRAFFAQVQEEGRRRVSRAVEHYNLDVILSVGYRVHSRRGTQFRIWATRTLREHLLRGYTLHERRLRERGIGASSGTRGPRRRDAHWIAIGPTPLVRLAWPGVLAGSRYQHCSHRLSPAWRACAELTIPCRSKA